MIGVRLFRRDIAILEMKLLVQLKHMRLSNFLIASVATSISFHIIPLQAASFTWGCMGPSSMGSSLRINGPREPGGDTVNIRNSSNKIVLRLTATGPVTEEVLSGVGRNGEDGFVQKRVYVDDNKKRWIYKNWDAHPSFKSLENPGVVISCFP